MRAPLADGRTPCAPPAPAAPGSSGFHSVARTAWRFCRVQGLESGLTAGGLGSFPLGSLCSGAPLGWEPFIRWKALVACPCFGRTGGCHAPLVCLPFGNMEHVPRGSCPAQGLCFLCRAGDSALPVFLAFRSPKLLAVNVPGRLKRPFLKARRVGPWCLQGIRSQMDRHTHRHSIWCGY